METNKTIPSWLEQILQEKNDLDAKIFKLRDGLNTSLKSLPPKRLSLLRQQLEIMEEYSDILQQRIEQTS